MSVILDLGSREWRAGLEGDLCPRIVAQVADLLPVYPAEPALTAHLDALWSLSKDAHAHSIEKTKTLFLDALKNLLLYELCVDPRSRNAIVVEPCLWPTPIHSVVDNILTKSLRCSGVTFIPADVCAAAGSGVSTALIVDLGFHECMASPVAHLTHVGDSYVQTSTFCAAREMLVYLRALLKTHAKVLTNGIQHTVDILEPSVINDALKILHVTQERPPSLDVSTYRTWAAHNNIQDIEIALPETRSPRDFYRHDAAPRRPMSTLHIPGWLRSFAAERLFEKDPEDLNVVDLCLKSLAKAPLDLRRSLAANIILVGGLSHITGVAERLQKDITEQSTLAFPVRVSLGGPHAAFTGASVLMNKETE